MEILLDLQRTIKKPQVIRREQGLRREYGTKDKPSGWRTTDPLRHNPDNFRYIVHTTSKSSLDKAAWETYARGLSPKREMQNNSWEVLIADFFTRNSTSCSLVDEIHRATYKWDVMPQGFILDVPEENIVAINPTDLGTHNYVQDKQERARIHHAGIELRRVTPSAQAFLETCRDDFRNEVLIDGIGPEGKQIRITAIFFITDPYLGIPLDELYSKLNWHPEAVFKRVFNQGRSEEGYQVNSVKREYQEMKNLAKLLQVPIVHIPAILY